MIKDLPPDEVPEFWKDLVDGKINLQPKMSTKELMKKVYLLALTQGDRTRKMKR